MIPQPLRPAVAWASSKVILGLWDLPFRIASFVSPTCHVVLGPNLETDCFINIEYDGMLYFKRKLSAWPETSDAGGASCAPVT
jgi:hypothetical protein